MKTRKFKREILNPDNLLFIGKQYVKIVFHLYSFYLVIYFTEVLTLPSNLLETICFAFPRAPVKDQTN